MKDIILIALFAILIVGKVFGYFSADTYIICAFIFIHSFIERDNSQEP